MRIHPETGYRGRVRPIRRRPGRILLVLLAASLLLGWWQGRANRMGRRTMAEQALASVLLPAQQAAEETVAGLIAAVTYLPRSRHFQDENVRLRDKVARLQAENTRLREARLENHRLRNLVRLEHALPGPAVAAGVVSGGLAGWSPLLTIGAGELQGVRRGMPVVTNAGVVGQVYSVSGKSSVVVPIWDRTSGIACLVQRSRQQAVARGDGRGGLLLRYLPTDADLRPGDLVISSGLGGVYPKGLMVGRVTAVGRKSGGVTRSAQVRPAVDWRRLEEVLVLTAER